MKYSQDEDTKLRGGDLRYFDATSKELPASIVKAAFALINTGDVSPVVDANNGSWYVLKQTGRRKSLTKSLDDAKPADPQQAVPATSGHDRAEGLRRRAARPAAKIEINEPNLAKVRIDTSQAVDDGHGRDLPPIPMPLGVLPPPPRPRACKLLPSRHAMIRRSLPPEAPP